ncbi:hypothetical protein GCM10022215_23990 [Nocardioides fonticola]|uniref:Secreted peptide n=1 Tax=Nocardioides fonticola TaxID=450363 RepID=A0ABP7XL39_9ACTN
MRTAVTLLVARPLTANVASPFAVQIRTRVSVPPKRRRTRIRDYVIAYTAVASVLSACVAMWTVLLLVLI